MKKGLLVWKSPGRLKNIGDYVQSIAAEQYVGRDVVYVEREETDQYTGEPVKLIMNGWFMHNPENWPPAENIFPLFVSFHMSPDRTGGRMLTEKSIEYFKNYAKEHGPVGARDKGTEQMLKSKDIPAYFSGCLTLTLGKTFKHNPNSERICFVDPFSEPKLRRDIFPLISYYFTVLTKRKTISKIAKKLYGSESLVNLLKTAQFFQTYSEYFEVDVLENAEYIKHVVSLDQFEDEGAKLEYSRNLLRKYADSSLVVTSRIHAALPCLGIGTPVIFTISDDLHPNGKGLPRGKGRFDGIIDLFNVMENVNYKLKPVMGFSLGKKVGLKHNIRNKKNHIKMAEEMDKICTDFVKNVNQDQKRAAYSNS